MEFMANFNKILLGKDTWELQDYFHLALFVIFMAIIIFITVKFYTPPLV